MAKRKRRMMQTSEQKVKKTKIDGPTNPFELRLSKKKHDIVGQKVKGIKGNMGISRSRADDMRKQTLLLEHRSKEKANVFLDKRFGENDKSLSVEDKMMLRFTHEKKRHDKPGAFNLNDENPYGDSDDEPALTHKGRSINDIDNFDDRDLKLSDDEDDENGGMNAKLVSNLHFGGFQQSGGPIGRDNDQRSHREIMAEVVMRSKAHKYERQKEREVATTLTEQLDEEFDSIMGLLEKRGTRKDHTEDQPKEKIEETDDYDKSVFNMRNDMKAKATDRLKTDEEIAWEEYEKLRKLEAERLKRMRGEESAENKIDQSVEELEGNAVQEDTREELFYDDGAMVVKGKRGIESSGDEKEDEDEEGEEEEEVDEEEEEDEDEEDEDSDEYVSDLELEDEEGEEAQPSSKAAPKGADGKEEKKSKAVKEKAAIRSDLPFIFKAPEDMESWTQLVEGRSSADILVIVERMRTGHHIKLKPENRAKMQKFLEILIDYLGEVCEDGDMELANGLVAAIHTLGLELPFEAATLLRAELSGIHDTMTTTDPIIDLHTIMMLRLVMILFPASDFQHSVTTPASLILGEILCNIVPHGIASLTGLLFVAHLAQDFVLQSHRYFPEPIAFLTSLIDVFATANSEGPRPKDDDHCTQTQSSLTKLPLDHLKFDGQGTVKVSPLCLGLLCTETLVPTDSLRVGILYNALELINHWVDIYKELSCLDQIFAPVLYHLCRLPTDLSAELDVKVQSTIEIIEKATSTCIGDRTHLRLQKRRPLALKQFTPRFEEKYVMGQSYDPVKERREERKTRHIVKRELKHTKREIEKDTAFLAREKLKDILEADKDRQDKVKRLFSILADQQAEGNHLTKLKDKMNKKRG